MESAPTASKRGKRSGCLIALAIVSGVGMIGSTFQRAMQSPEKQGALDQAEEERANGDLATLSIAQQAIQQSMKDSSSAEFSRGYGRIKHGQRAACGYVNGKNSFGALTGPEPWLAVIDQNIVMVRGFDNQVKFVRLWNRYCTGLDDRDKPFPKEIFGIKFNARPPASLKPYDESRNVWLYRDEAPREFLSVKLKETMFLADNGRIFGAMLTATGEQAYDRWRDAIRRQYSAPSSIGEGDQPVLEWKWTKNDPTVQLSYNANRGEVMLRVGM